VSDGESAYGAWVVWLKAFGEGKAPDMTTLPPLTERHGDQVLMRFGNRCDAALAALFKLVAEAHRKGMGRARSATDVEWHLVALRALIRPAVALARTTLLPEPVRAEIDRAVTDAVTRFQGELERNAALPGSQAAALGSVVKRARLTLVLEEAPGAASRSPGGLSGRGRKTLEQESS
jgi:hypothetical protein